MVNGVAWKSTGKMDVILTPLSLLVAGHASMPVNLNVYNLNLQLFEPTAVGTIPLDAFPNHRGTGGLTAGNDVRTSQSPGGTGTLTITVFTSSRIAGTFSFDIPATATSPIAFLVTNGVFDTVY
jgi:hypothetical protein